MDQSKKKDFIVFEKDDQGVYFVTSLDQEVVDDHFLEGLGPPREPVFSDKPWTPEDQKAFANWKRKSHKSRK